MTLSVFLQGLALVVLLSIAFGLGGYVSFKIIASHRVRQADAFLNDIFTNDQLRIKLKDMSDLLEKEKKCSKKLSDLCDRILSEILLKVSINPKIDGIVLTTLISQSIEDYSINRSKIYE